MASSKAPKQGAARRHWPVAEKRRIVELTLGEGASLRTIAREQGVNRNSLYQWQALYRAGKLPAAAPRVRGTTSGATFLPVSIAAGRTPSATCSSASSASSKSVVQVMLASGATVRIETGALEARFVCDLISELQR
jgi:transposase-like protein